MQGRRGQGERRGEGSRGEGEVREAICSFNPGVSHIQRPGGRDWEKAIMWKENQENYHGTLEKKVFEGGRGSTRQQLLRM